MEFKDFKVDRLNNEQLLCGLDKLIKSERKLMHIILAYIHEVETRKLHLDLGYDSIFKFLTAHHGYSEDAAYARMHGARLFANFPELSAKLEEGAISLTQITKVCSATRAAEKSGKTVTDEQTRSLLQKIENKNLFETRQTIAIELDQPIIETQSVKPQKDGSILLQVTLSKAQYDALIKARNLISHSVTDHNLADTIEHLSNFLIKKTEGQRAEVPANLKSKDCGASENDSSRVLKQDLQNANLEKRDLSARGVTQSFRIIRKRRKHISIKVRRQLIAESGGRCCFEHPESGTRCESRYQLQTDHIIPVAEGGSDEISNLRMMCGIHNRDRSRTRVQDSRAQGFYGGERDRDALANC